MSTFAKPSAPRQAATAESLRFPDAEAVPSSQALSSSSGPPARSEPSSGSFEVAAPLYLFRVPALVFEPFEALARLAVALLREPSRVERIRFVVEGDVAEVRANVLSAVLVGRASSSRTTDAPWRTRRDGYVTVSEASEAAFAPVTLAATPSLVDVALRTFAWMDLHPNEAPQELEALRVAASLDDDERAMRGELSVLASRVDDVSHLVLFDDGARELLRISVPKVELPTGRTTGFGAELEARLEGVLRQRA